MAPVWQDAISSGRRQDDGIAFDPQKVYRLYAAIAETNLPEEAFHTLAAVAAEADNDAFRVRDGWYVHPFYEMAYTEVFYADPKPFPHADNSTCRFRVFSGSGGGFDFLADVTFAVAPGSAFGCHITKSSELESLYASEVEILDFSAQQGGYIFPDSDSRLLTQDDLDLAMDLESSRPQELGCLLRVA